MCDVTLASKFLIYQTMWCMCTSIVYIRLVSFLVRGFVPLFRSFLDWFQSSQTTRRYCLRLKDVLMFQASPYYAGKRTFQWMLLNSILWTVWMAPDHQAVYLGDNYTLSLPFWIHVQCKIAILRFHTRGEGSILLFIYYSNVMSFYHIRSRERAKYEAVIIILFNNISVWFC